MIIPDTHIGDEDKRAYKLMLSVTDEVEPDEIVILGDYADFYSVSAHAKSANMAAMILHEEIEAVNERLDELDHRFPKANKVFIQGNHEWRLERYISEKCPELFKIVDCPSLFKLNDRKNWKWVPYGPYQSHKVLNSKLIARHTPIGGGVHHAKSTVIKSMASVVYGHVHQYQEAQIVGLDGHSYRAWCPGWLGNKNSDSMQYVQNHAQWTLGFSIVSVLPNGNWFAQTCQIIDYTTIYNGLVYRA